MVNRGAEHSPRSRSGSEPSPQRTRRSSVVGPRMPVGLRPAGNGLGRTGMVEGENGLMDGVENQSSNVPNENDGG